MKDLVVGSWEEQGGTSTIAEKYRNPLPRWVGEGAGQEQKGPPSTKAGGRQLIFNIQVNSAFKVVVLVVNINFGAHFSTKFG